MTWTNLAARAFAGFLLVATTASAESPLPDHNTLPPRSQTIAADEVVDVSLVPGVDAVVPGEPFLMGVRIVIDRPWHIYWKYPGDAGVATKLQWDLPDGFAVSEPQFPIPNRFMQPGDIAGYGYEDETVLIAKIVPPKDLAVGSEVSIGVRATFLRCIDVCVPGKATLKATLPVAAASNPHPWLGSWQAKMAVHARPELTSLTVQPAAEPNRWVAKATFGDVASAESVEWFPAPPGRLVIGDLKQWTEERVAVLSFTVGGTVPPTPEIPLLVAFTDRAGRRVGVEQVVTEVPSAEPRPDK